MMSGKFKHYNWNDIRKLIFKDAGLEEEIDQRTKGEMWCVNSFTPPEYDKDTIIKVEVFDKPSNERLEEHVK